MSISTKLMGIFASTLIISVAFLVFPESKKGKVFYFGILAILIGWFGVEVYLHSDVIYALLENIFHTCISAIVLGAVAVFVMNFFIKS